MVRFFFPLSLANAVSNREVIKRKESFVCIFFRHVEIKKKNLHRYTIEKNNKYHLRFKT